MTDYRILDGYSKKTLFLLLVLFSNLITFMLTSYLSKLLSYLIISSFTMRS